MKPFALRFALPIDQSSERALPPMKYDPEIEMMVLSYSPSQFSIDQLDTGMATGSWVTKADGDPTRDEPTDRY